jgi:hypothetical protein
VTRPEAGNRRIVALLRGIEMLVAGLGRKPGKETALSMLLEIHDLPGDDWQVVRERSWKTGVVGKSTARSIRAREIGSISVERKFRRSKSLSTIALAIYPYASISDAQSAAQDSRAALLAYRPMNAKVTSEASIENLSMPGIDNPWALEQHIEEPARSGLRKLARGNVNRFVVGLGSFAPGQGWAWGDLVPLVVAQGEKLRRSLDGSDVSSK